MYWNGKVGYIKVNGVRYDTLVKLPGWSGNNIEARTQYGFLTNEQAALLYANIDLPNVIVSAVSDRVDVYTKISGRVYAKLSIDHTVDTSTGLQKYKDLWRLASNGDICVYDGTTFTSIGVSLLVGAENEFAIRFSGFTDFTGGYHGYERIDTDASCYVVFVLDGKEYSITDLVNLGTVKGGTFGYRQKSFCYTDDGYTAHPNTYFAKHVKTTNFVDGGFITRNYFELDLTDLGVNTLTATDVFLGLVCVNKDCAEKVVGDDGTIYTTSHPSSSTPLVNNISKTSRLVKMFKNNVSCLLDTKLIGTSISAYSNPEKRVMIMDRSADEKYYSYLPSNIAWNNSDNMETECSVRWNYRQ